MRGIKMILACRVLTWSALAAAVTGLFLMPAQSAAHEKKGQPDSVCPGFVVLENGHAVLSEEGQGMTSDKGHDHGKHKMDKMKAEGQHHGEKKMTKMEAKGHDHGEKKMTKMAAKSHEHSEKKMHKMTGHGHHKDKAAGHHQHLMGYQHGQAIVAGKEHLCVPIGSAGDTSWMGLSRDPSLYVMAESLRGALAHNSRANEGFDMTIMQSGGKPLEKAGVQLFVRMPHHDHRMPGGHGPANDPDVKGIPVMLDDQGRYRVNTVDFSMAGPWLLEVVVKNGGKTHKAYFAPRVGEE